MLCIMTKYIGPKNTKPARVKAYTSSARPTTGKRESVTLSYHGFNSTEEAHNGAALALAQQVFTRSPRTVRNLCIVGETLDGLGWIYQREHVCRVIGHLFIE